MGEKLWGRGNVIYLTALLLILKDLFYTPRRSQNWKSYQSDMELIVVEN